MKGLQNKPPTQEFYHAGTVPPSFEILRSATAYIYTYEICQEKCIIQILVKCILILLWSCGLYNIRYRYKLNQVNVTNLRISERVFTLSSGTHCMESTCSASFLKTWISISVFPISISVSCVLYKLCDNILLYISYQIYILKTLTMKVFWIMQCIKLYILFNFTVLCVYAFFMLNKCTFYLWHKIIYSTSSLKKKPYVA